MRFFRLHPLADAGTGDFCFTDETPDGIGARWSRLHDGKPFGHDYPAGAVTLRLGKDYRGQRLPSVLGNTSNLLCVDHATAAVMLAARSAPIEVLPFTLLDRQGRPCSDDYVFLNPLARVACLHEQASELRLSRKGELKDIPQLVLDGARLDAAPDLFRLGELSSIYVVSETLVAALAANGSSNLAITDAEVQWYA